MKELIWVGSSLKDIRDFPEEVKDEVGYALHVGKRSIKYTFQIAI